MRPVSVLLLLAASLPAAASDPLYWNGGGYSIEIVVGASLTSLRFAAPGAKALADLALEDVKVKALDRTQRQLTLVYKSSDRSSKVPAFTLKVKGNRGTLVLDDQEIQGAFDWTR